MHSEENLIGSANAAKPSPHDVVRSAHPNFRVYDADGNTEDIVATSLEDAIKRGRDWIERSSDVPQDRFEHPLPCSVGEISDDADGDVDEDATGENTRHECWGLVRAEPPARCRTHEDAEWAGVDVSEADEDGYMWCYDHDAVGGYEGNAGVFSSGHGQYYERAACRLSGVIRITNHGDTDPATGQCATSVSYNEPDNRSISWLRERWTDEDGNLAAWVAEYIEKHECRLGVI